MKAIIRTLVSTIQEYPSIAAGACGFLVAFSMVAGNALYGQPGRHPGPFWPTRDPVLTRTIGKNESRIGAQGRLQIEKVSVQSIPVPVMRPLETSRLDQGSSLVRDTQSALAGLAMFTGEIDGRFGPKTRDAIIRFQNLANIEATGQVGVALLEAIRSGKREAQSRVEQAAKAPAEEVLPPLSQRADGAAQSDGTGVVTETLADVTRAAMIARIQIGLINFGESAVVVDGLLGPGTVSAIRGFQHRYGLPVTGEPDALVVRKLESIGVLQKS